MQQISWTFPLITACWKRNIQAFKPVLGQAGSVQYGHDKSGFRNLKIEGANSNPRETHCHYEPSGLLLAVDLADGRRIDYRYDAKGQRAQKRVNGRVV